MEFKKLRRDTERFVRALEKEYYSNWAGLKEKMNTDAIFSKYSSLFEPDVLSRIKVSKSHSSREDRRKLRYLECALTSGYLERNVRVLTDKRNTLESKLKIKVGGDVVPFRMAAVKTVNEDDRTLRGDIQEARDAAIENDLNPILDDRMSKLHELARSLGYRNYSHLFSRTKRIDFEGLRKKLDVMIGATEKLYIEKMGALTESIGVKLKDAEKHDIGYLFRAKAFDKHFKKNKAIPTLKRTLKGLGINMDAQKNVVLDAEERPKKMPRAFCAALEVPDKVMLVIMPMGGCSDYDTLLHEAGHAEHYAHMKKDDEMEYKYLGDNSVTETYAFLLQYLNADENWLKDNTKMNSDEISSYLDFVYTQKLFFVRRYAAKLMYELILHKRGTKGMGQRYKKTMEGVLKFKHPAGHYLTDLDDGFYAAQYLRAWLFESQLRRELRHRFDDEWFLSTKAGNYIKSLWAHGQKYDVDELSKDMGYELRPKELVEDLKEHLTN
jgi:oligoendopeptidase F